MIQFFNIFHGIAKVEEIIPLLQHISGLFHLAQVIIGGHIFHFPRQTQTLCLSRLQKTALLKHKQMSLGLAKFSLRCHAIYLQNLFTRSFSHIGKIHLYKKLTQFF